MPKRKQDMFLAFRVGAAAAVLAVCFAFGAFVKNSVAQSWSEPTETPPSGNVLPPIWNQNSSAQSGSLYVTGSARVDASNYGNSYCLLSKICAADAGAAWALVGESNSGYGVYASSVSSYGLYAASASNYAGYFSGAVYVNGSLSTTGAITQGGKAVCLSDGTNCAVSGGFWAASGNDIYNTNSGNVGIGVVSAVNRLDVRSSSPTVFASMGSANSDASRYLFFFGGDITPHDPAISWTPGTALRFGTGAYNASTYTELVRITGDGKLGIGTNNPVYALDVNGTINGAGNSGIGLLGTSDSSYGVYGSSTSGSAVAGVSTLGYGVYGSSLSNYAGYFNGTLNATGTITQNGVAVCLSDGTNCPSSSKSTRAPVAYSSTLAAKDAQCVAEFGSGYQTATYADAMAYYGKSPLYAGHYSRYDTNWNPGNAQTDVTSLGLIDEGSTEFRWSSSISGSPEGRTYNGYTKTVLSGGSRPVLCVNKSAPLLRTRVTLAYGSTLAAKDAQCVDEFGSQYQTSTYNDALLYLGESMPLTYRRALSAGGFGNDSNSDYMGLTTNANSGLRWYTYSYNNSYPNVDEFGWEEKILTSGSLGVLCERK